MGDSTTAISDQTVVADSLNVFDTIMGESDDDEPAEEASPPDVPVDNEEPLDFEPEEESPPLPLPLPPPPPPPPAPTPQVPTKPPVVEPTVVFAPPIDLRTRQPILTSPVLHALRLQPLADRPWAWMVVTQEHRPLDAWVVKQLCAISAMPNPGTAGFSTRVCINGGEPALADFSMPMRAAFFEAVLQMADGLDAAWVRRCSTPAFLAEFLDHALECVPHGAFAELPCATLMEAWRDAPLHWMVGDSSRGSVGSISQLGTELVRREVALTLRADMQRRPVDAGGSAVDHKHRAEQMFEWAMATLYPACLAMFDRAHPPSSSSMQRLGATARLRGSSIGTDVGGIMTVLRSLAGDQNKAQLRLDLKLLEDRCRFRACEAEIKALTETKTGGGGGSGGSELKPLDCHPFSMDQVLAYARHNNLPWTWAQLKTLDERQPGRVCLLVEDWHCADAQSLMRSLADERVDAIHMFVGSAGRTQELKRLQQPAEGRVLVLVADPATADRLWLPRTALWAAFHLFWDKGSDAAALQLTEWLFKGEAVQSPVSHHPRDWKTTLRRWALACAWLPAYIDAMAQTAPEWAPVTATVRTAYIRRMFRTGLRVHIQGVEGTSGTASPAFLHRSTLLAVEALLLSVSGMHGVVAKILDLRIALGGEKAFVFDGVNGASMKRLFADCYHVGSAARTLAASITSTLLLAAADLAPSESDSPLGAALAAAAFLMVTSVVLMADLPRALVTLLQTGPVEVLRSCVFVDTVRFAAAVATKARGDGVTSALHCLANASMASTGFAHEAPFCSRLLLAGTADKARLVLREGFSAAPYRVRAQCRPNMASERESFHRMRQTSVVFPLASSFESSSSSSHTRMDPVVTVQRTPTPLSPRSRRLARSRSRERTERSNRLRSQPRPPSLRLRSRSRSKSKSKSKRTHKDRPVRRERSRSPAPKPKPKPKPTSSQADQKSKLKPDPKKSLHPAAPSRPVRPARPPRNKREDNRGRRGKNGP